LFCDRRLAEAAEVSTTPAATSMSTTPATGPLSIPLAPGASQVRVVARHGPRTSQSRLEALSATAAQQHGILTWGQLRELGLGKDRIGRLTRTGVLHRVRPQVYAVGHLALTPAAEVLAAVLSLGDEAAASHGSAALAHGLLAPWQLPDTVLPVHVTVPRGVRRGPRRDVVLHTLRLEAADVQHVGPLRLTTVERTLIDLGTTADLRRVERATDQALVDGRTTSSALRGALERAGGRPGVATLRTVVDAAERYAGLTRSELEAELRRLVAAAGLGQLWCNARVRGVGGRLDAFFPDGRVAVEVDGWAWHRTGLRQHLDRTKELQARRAGILLVRYSARQVFEQPLLVVGDLGLTLAARRDSGAHGGGRPAPRI
jgi:predicted transcriptional regulator of viral defense system